MLSLLLLLQLLLDGCCSCLVLALVAAMMIKLLLVVVVVVMLVLPLVAVVTFAPIASSVVSLGDNVGSGCLCGIIELISKT